MNTTLAHKLLAHAQAGRLRTLALPQGVDLCSSDYLGFSCDPILQQRFIKRLQNLPLGATASRLLRGNLALHEDTEAKLAAFVGRETALLLPSSYQANLALLSSVLNKDTLVFSDALNHASIIDGMRLAQSQKFIYPHLDYAHLETLLSAQQNNPATKFIVTESLFSMEGTIADLAILAQLAQRYNAHLIVDEAHSTGLWGGSLVATLGLTQQVFASVHAAGKALGAAGGFIAGDTLLKEYLVNFARPFIFSTGVLPAQAILLQEIVEYYAEIGLERAQQTLQHAAFLRRQLAGKALAHSTGPIVPIIIGDNANTLHLAQALQQQGWDVRAIRPPTVPEGTARLRITVKYTNTTTQLEHFAHNFNLLAKDYLCPFNLP